MINSYVTGATLSLSLASLITSFAHGQSSGSTSDEMGPYHVSQTFHIGGDGAWDYLTVDPEHKLLFVPRSTHTMVLDAKTGKTVADSSGRSAHWCRG